MKIDIRKFVFSHQGNEHNERTTKRLNQLIEMGCEETGNASFGFKEKVSGLYIERVWSYSDEEWNDHIVWMQELINKKDDR